jgi:hypothetical protein
MNQAIIAIISYYASMYGIDPKLAVSVAMVESSLNPNAIGSKGEVGLFQLRPEIFNHIPKDKLITPETNIRNGIKHLAWNKKYCNHKKEKTWLICYNYGIGNAKKVKHPKLFPYYKKVMMNMEKFEKGELVIVTGMYELKVDGEGIFMGVSTGYHDKGRYKIKNEHGLIMLVEPTRVVKYQDYWDKKKYH